MQLTNIVTETFRPLKPIDKPILSNISLYKLPTNANISNYNGLKLVEETPYNGGTSIKYWM